MFKIFNKKTLKRLTRFGLCCYILLYCMGFTVCAEGDPFWGRSHGPEPLAAPSVDGRVIEFDGSSTTELMQAIIYESLHFNGAGTTIVLKKDLKADLSKDGFENLNGFHNLSIPTGSVLIIDGNGHKITPKNDTFTDSLLYFHNGIFGNMGELTIANLTLQGGRGSGVKGGAIHFDNPNSRRSVQIEDCSFIENKGNLGGAVYTLSALDYLTIAGCTFINNTAIDVTSGSGSTMPGNSSGIPLPSRYPGQGGAIYQAESRENRLSIADSFFINNTANDGGVVYFKEGSLNIENSSFINNTARSLGQGGAIYLEKSRESAISNSYFINNSAKYGGAFYFWYGYLFVSNSSFINNSANSGGLGGAIYQINYGSANFKRVAIAESLFFNNSAKNGCAIYGEGGEASIDDCSFIQNFLSENSNNANGILSFRNTTPLKVEGSLLLNNLIDDGSILTSMRGQNNSFQYNVFLNNTGNLLSSDSWNSWGINNNWFGNLGRDYNTKPSINNLRNWIFLNISRSIDSDTGKYRLEAVPYLYNSTGMEEISNLTENKLPPITLNCFSPYGARFDNASGSVPAQIILNRSHCTPAFFDVIPGDEHSYKVSVTTQNGNSENLEYQRSIKIGDTNAIGYSPYSASNITALENGSAITQKVIDGKRISISIAEIGEFNSTIKKGNSTYVGNFTYDLGSSAYPGVYNVTYTVEGFDSYSSKLNITKIGTAILCVNGTAEDAGSKDPAELYPKKIADCKEGRGGLLRFYAAAAHSGRANKGKLFILNGTDDITRTDNILEKIDLTDKRQYAELDLRTLKTGFWNLTAVYIDDSEDPSYYNCSSAKDSLIFKVKPFYKENTEDKVISVESAAGVKGSVDLTEYILPGGELGIPFVTEDTGKVLSGAPSVNGSFLQYAIANNNSLAGCTAKISVPVENADEFNDYFINVTIKVVEGEYKPDHVKKNKTITLPGLNPDGSASVVTLFYPEKTIYYNGKDHVWNGTELSSRQKKKKEADLDIDVTGLPSTVKAVFVYRNNKDASEEKACFYLKLKLDKTAASVKALSKDGKKSLKKAIGDANKVLRNKENRLYFSIKSLDLESFAFERTKSRRGRYVFLRKDGSGDKLVWRRRKIEYMDGFELKETTKTELIAYLSGGRAEIGKKQYKISLSGGTITITGKGKNLIGILSGKL